MPVFLPMIELPLPNTKDIPFIQSNFEHLLLLPYSKEAQKLSLLKGEKIIAQTSLSALADTCGNGKCDGAENHASCRLDCAIDKDNFCETTNICDPNCPSQKGCKQSKSVKYWISFVIILGALLFGIKVLRKARKNR